MDSQVVDDAQQRKPEVSSSHQALKAVPKVCLSRIVRGAARSSSVQSTSSSVFCWAPVAFGLWFRAPSLLVVVAACVLEASDGTKGMGDLLDGSLIAHLDPANAVIFEETARTIFDQHQDLLTHSCSSCEASFFVQVRAL